ncbi:hypothetical protein MSTO_12390 [Mycobacterium stomatepiae]|uniref:Uncharacterized protein n=1 Tax=Mycobacterium stomatepiae TaxID=470076 RepID=A0A7I7Q3W7_9MYCO|nr:hypothetical protein MSTO_12390 [Mycobacterium stomatepiae]
MSPSTETLRNRNLRAPAVVGPQTKTQLLIGKIDPRYPRGLGGQLGAHTGALANRCWREQYEGAPMVDIRAGTSEQYPALGEM